MSLIGWRSGITSGDETGKRVPTNERDHPWMRLKSVACIMCVVERALLQVYNSALIFTPGASIIKNLFADELPSWIERLPIVEDNWAPSLQAIEGHSNWVRAVVFSPDGQLLASASSDHTVRLWDPATGALRGTLQGHSALVKAVIFSPDGQLLASTSWDHTVKLWDIKTKISIQKFQYFSKEENLALSKDGTHLEIGQRLIKIQSSFPGLAPNTQDQTSALSSWIVSWDWVMYHGSNVLWLPFNHRSSAHAFHDNILVLGSQSGRVAFFQFSTTIAPF